MNMAKLKHINAIYLEPDTPQDPAIAQAIAETIADLAGFLEAKKISYGAKIPPFIAAAL